MGFSMESSMEKKSEVCKQIILPSIFCLFNFLLLFLKGIQVWTNAKECFSKM